MGAQASQCAGICSGKKTRRRSNVEGPGNGNAKPERKASARISVAACNAYADRRGVSINYTSEGEDAKKFDEAFDQGDLPGFVALLSSQQPIASFEDRLHPWAEDPKSIGALACTQLAIMASVVDAEDADAGVKDRILEAGALPHLAEFLRSSETDRVQAAMVTLSFLTIDCPANVTAAYEAGIMPLIVKHLESDIVGMRAASSSVLRCMYTERRDYLEEFLKLGGVKGLVAQLAMPPDQTMNHIDVQLEAVLNIQDLIDIPNSPTPQVDKVLAQEVVSCGAREPLQKLRESGDADLQASVEELLDMLEEVDAIILPADD